ncbi:hypothetical protein [Alloactinosynnema sp. L-07]|uniref:hypothetical protein n=1 Tax=Alloactinosynnema sp. L-07 TaxID=1653480 RepID=UPI00065EF993|nr:hypothetical protein [Alloactinosynnema sp. L-07]CRK56938.1 hypothetical protein [Alloactinosynnema sp. L-07]
MTDGMLDLDLRTPSAADAGSSREVHPLLCRRGLARRHVHQYIDFTGQRPATVVMSNGNGVDSAAILFGWLTDPSTRDFDLDELLIITACTGEEYPSTFEAVDAHLIPALAAAGVRFLQVGRGGQAVSDGYDVLADSFAPTHLVRRGAWHLGSEMDAALTVPQVVDGRRECSVDCTKSDLIKDGLSTRDGKGFGVCLIDDGCSWRGRWTSTGSALSRLRRGSSLRSSSSTQPGLRSSRSPGTCATWR